jgi:hypothetical protein
MRFIKIGPIIINPSHIVYAEVLPDRNRIHVDFASNTALSDETQRVFEGSEAEALIKFLFDPNRTQDLCPSSPDVEGFQLYRQRGGDMTFEEYSAVLRQQQRLCAVERPSEQQLAQCSELENKLLL